MSADQLQHQASSSSTTAKAPPAGPHDETASSSRIDSPSHSSPPVTAFQAKAIAALNNMGSLLLEDEISLSDWTIPTSTSNDPDIELLVFPIEVVGPLLAGVVGLKAKESEKAKERARVAAKEALRDEAKRKSSGLVTKFKPLLGEEREEFSRNLVWPRDYDFAIDEETENYGDDFWRRLQLARRQGLKQQLSEKIDSSPCPPPWDDIVAEVHLMQIRYFYQDLAFIKKRAKLEDKPIKSALPPNDWAFKTLNNLVTVVHKYQGTPPSPTCPEFRAWILAAGAFETFQEEILGRAGKGASPKGGEGGRSSGGLGGGKRPQGRKGGPRNPKKKGRKGGSKGSKK